MRIFSENPPTCLFDALRSQNISNNTSSLHSVDRVFPRRRVSIKSGPSTRRDTKVCLDRLDGKGCAQKAHVKSHFLNVFYCFLKGRALFVCVHSQRTRKVAVNVVLKVTGQIAKLDKG
jgi:hypothetical protein